MASKTLTISVPQEQVDFMDEHGLSPSAVMQMAIENKRLTYNDFSKERIEYQRRIKVMAEELRERTDFIFMKGLQTEYDLRSMK